MLVALRVLLQVLPAGGALGCCCQSGVRASNHAFRAGMLVSGCLWKALLEGAVKLAYWWCCYKVLQSKWCVRFGVGMFVPSQDAAAGLNKHKF